MFEVWRKGQKEPTLVEGDWAVQVGPPLEGSLQVRDAAGNVVAEFRSAEVQGWSKQSDSGFAVA